VNDKSSKSVYNVVKKETVMIKRVDHIIIRTPDPRKTSKEIEAKFGLVAPPVMEFELFASVMFTFGNVNIELLKMGEETDFEPYLYGVAFESHKESWALLGDLKQRNIEHTLPITQKTEMISWTNIMLKGLLDNVMPSSYGMHSDNKFNRAMSRFFEKLMGLNFVAKALMKDVGDALIFFCEYDERIKEYNEYAQKVFSAFKGGTYGIKGVESLVIQRSKENENWENIGNLSDSNSVQLLFKGSDINKLDHIVLDSQTLYYDEVVMIGNVKFVIN